jgi:glycosyltransferase involved in cell wall biosynthesis
MIGADRSAPRLMLVVDPRDPGRSIAPGLLLGALADGWDAHLVCDARTQVTNPHVNELPVDIVRERVHPPPAELKPAHAARARAFGRSVKRHPVMTLSAALTGPKSPGRPYRIFAAGFAPDVTHIIASPITPAWIALTKRYGARTLISVGSAMVAAALDAPDQYRAAWRAADALHVGSGAVADLLRREGVSDDAILVAPPPAELQLLKRQPASVQGGPLLQLLSVGQLSWSSGYEHALIAVRLLRERGFACSYRIVGSGAHRDAVALACDRLGLVDCVELVDHASSPLNKDLQWAHVLIEAGVVGGSPEVVLNAQAAGVPVVSTLRPQDAPASVLSVPPLDSEALAEAVISASHDAPLRAKLVAAGRSRARATPTRAAELHALRGLHRRLLRTGEAELVRRSAIDHEGPLGSSSADAPPVVLPQTSLAERSSTRS